MTPLVAAAHPLLHVAPTPLEERPLCVASTARIMVVPLAGGRLRRQVRLRRGPTATTANASPSEALQAMSAMEKDVFIYTATPSIANTDTLHTVCIPEQPCVHPLDMARSREQGIDVVGSSSLVGSTVPLCEPSSNPINAEDFHYTNTIQAQSHLLASTRCQSFVTGPNSFVLNEAEGGGSNQNTLMRSSSEEKPLSNSSANTQSDSFSEGSPSPSSSNC